MQRWLESDAPLGLLDAPLGLLNMALPCTHDTTICVQPANKLKCARSCAEEKLFSEYIYMLESKEENSPQADPQ